MPPAIETKGLTKDYLVGFWRPRPSRALDGLTLSVQPGEVFGFLGPNGAGKSTTMRMITGFLAPTAGSVRICGTDMLADPLKAKDDATRIVLDVEKAKDWMAKGAQPTDRVTRMLESAGVLPKKARNNPKSAVPGKAMAERAKKKAERAADQDCLDSTPHDVAQAVS